MTMTKACVVWTNRKTMPANILDKYKGKGKLVARGYVWPTTEELFS